MQGRFGDFNACVQQYIKDGRAPKAAMNYAESLVSFFNWCVDMEYLHTNPLARFKRMVTTPVTKRRAMTPSEVKRILNVAPAYRRILYEVAFTTGLRARELRTLTMDDLDLERCGLIIKADRAKSRKGAFHQIPQRLAEDLYRFALSGEPRDQTSARCPKIPCST